MPWPAEPDPENPGLVTLRTTKVKIERNTSVAGETSESRVPPKPEWTGRNEDWPAYQENCRQWLLLTHSETAPMTDQTKRTLTGDSLPSQLQK
jgi:hypothetical protein